MAPTDRLVRIGVFGGDRLGVRLSTGIVDISELVPRSVGPRGPLSWFISTEWDRAIDWAQVVSGRPVLAADAVRWSAPLPGSAVIDPSNRASFRNEEVALGIVLAGDDSAVSPAARSDGVFGIARVRAHDDGSLRVAAEPLLVATGTSAFALPRPGGPDGAVSARAIAAAVRTGRALRLEAGDIVIVSH